MALGKRLKEAREYREKTRGWLAKQVKTAPGKTLSQTAVKNLEDRDSPTSRYSAQFAEALRINVEWLTTGRGSMIGGDNSNIDPKVLEVAKNLTLLPEDQFEGIMALVKNALKGIKRTTLESAKHRRLNDNNHLRLAH
jgi:hypothetical protein